MSRVPESNDLIRRGWHFANQYTRAGFENALSSFAEAAQQDSEDFRAFAGIACAYLMLAGFLMRAPRSIRDAYLQAHERAVALCGLTPELLADRAFGRIIFDGHPVEAAAVLLEMRQAGPCSVHVYIRLALAFMALGQLRQAAAALRQAQAGDMLFPELAFTETLLAIFSREFDAAVRLGRENMDLHPGSQIGRAFFAEALEHAGRPEEALAQYRLASEMSPDISWIRAQEARCLARHGRAAKAAVILRHLLQNREREYVDAYFLALLLHALGKPGQAFRELDRAREEGSYALLFAGVDPKADGLRASPRSAAWRGLRSAGALHPDWGSQSTVALDRSQTSERLRLRSATS